MTDIRVAVLANEHPYGFPMGGVATFTWSLVSELRNRLSNVYYISWHMGPIKRLNYDIILKGDVPQIYFESVYWWYRNRRYLDLVVEELHRIKPDIIHTQGHPGIAPAVEYKKRYDRNVVIIGTIHGTSHHMDKTCNNTELVIAVSRLGKSYIRYNCRKREVITIYPGTPPLPDPKPVQLDPRVVESSKPIIVSLLRPCEEKGFDILLEAVKGLEVKLLFAGWKTRDYGGLGLITNRSDIAFLLKHADICVMPSRFEAFGLASLEYMYSQCPTILTKRAGVVELLHGDEAVILWPNPVSVKNAIIKLMVDEDFRERIRRRGYEKARELMVWHRIAEKYVMVYKYMVDRELEKVFSLDEARYTTSTS